MSTDSKNLFVFLEEKFSELVHTIVSLGCRQLGNFTLLIRLPGTVSNEISARQLEIFTKMPLKGSFKLLKSMRCLLRNVKRFQKVICFFYWINSPSLCILQYRSVVDTEILRFSSDCRARSQMD